MLWAVTAYYGALCTCFSLRCAITTPDVLLCKGQGACFSRLCALVLQGGALAHGVLSHTHDHNATESSERSGMTSVFNLTQLVCCHAEAKGHASADSVQWCRKGVPLHIVSSQGPMERTLTDLVALVKVLFSEEQKAFHAAMADASDRYVSH